VNDSKSHDDNSIESEAPYGAGCSLRFAKARLLINALTEYVGASTNLSGYPTNQDLTGAAAHSSYSQS